MSEQRDWLACQRAIDAAIIFFRSPFHQDSPTLAGAPIQIPAPPKQTTHFILVMVFHL